MNTQFNKSSIRELKLNLDIIETAYQYCDLKSKGGNKYQAIINPLRDERTSSLHFDGNTQRFKDFGSGVGGDAIDFISQVENIPIDEVLKRLRTQNFPQAQQRQQKKIIASKVGLYDDISLEALKKEFDSFQELDFQNTEHLAEIKSTIPLWLSKTANEADLAMFLSITKFDAKNKTLVVGWYKQSLLNFDMVTYKRRRFNSGKWVNRKGTHPNSTPFYRIYNEKQNIHIVEGARDAITATLLGLNFIAIPTASFSNYEAINEIIAPHNHLVFICEDMTGYEAMTKISEHIKTDNKRLIALTKSKDIKIDLSDCAMSCSSIEEVLNGIC